MILAYLGSAWLLGIYLASLFQIPTELIWLATVLPAAVVILWWRERTIRLASACCLALLLGALRFNASIPQLNENSLAHYNDTGWTTIKGVVVAEPDVRDQWTNLRVDAHEIQIEDKWQRIEGTVLVQASRYPQYAYGDKLEISGLLETPPEFEDFSYRDYLANRGIYSILRRPQIKLLAHGQGNPIYAALFAFKEHALSTIGAVLPEPEASVLAGIVLGVGHGIPKDLEEQFNITGTTHILVISGSNIAFVAGILTGIGNRLVGKRKATPFVLAGIAMYTILVGADAAVVRAAIMGGLYVLALHYGRQSHALISLMVAASAMTLLDPRALWDLGFQLSFAATLGLILLVSPMQEGLESWLRKWLPETDIKQVLTVLNDALVITLAAQIMTAPIILYTFGRLSLVSPLTNFLVLPAQPMVMICGGIATLLGFVWLRIGQIVGWIAWLFLTYTIQMVEITARFPYASLNLGHVSPGLVWLYYGLLAGVMLVSRQEPPRLKSLWRCLTARLSLRPKLRPRGSPKSARLSTKVLIAGLAVAAILIWVAVASLPDGKLHVVFFDVEEGDAIFVQTPGGHQFLIDGGPSPTTLISALGHRMPFWDRSIDLVILTHADEDHIAGLIPVLERYRVAQVLDSGYEHDHPMYKRWLELIEEKDIPNYLARAGMRVRTGDGVELIVLHPGPELMRYTEADSNNNSVVTRLVMGQVSFLLPGDIEEAAERVLVASGQELISTVLKAPHHGSNTSSSAAFLKAVNPKLVVISVGADNRFGHPAPGVLRRLEDLVGEERILRTDQDGTIEVVTDGEGIWLKTD
jgi:competence protein ComEC